MVELALLLYFSIYPDDDYVHNSQSPSFMTSHLLMKKFRVTFNNNMILHNIFLSVFSLVYKCRCDFYINFKMSNFYHYDHHIIIFYFFIFLQKQLFFFYLLLERFNILRNKEKKSICQVEIETERVERRHNDRT